MSSDNKNIFTIIIIVVLITIITMMLGTYVYGDDVEKVNKVNWKHLFLGGSGGLAAWLCTYFVSKLIDTHDKKTTAIHNVVTSEANALSFDTNNKTTTDIYNIITGKYFSLVNENRVKLGWEFFAKHYDGASKIKISGLANRQFIDYLCSEVIQNKSGDKHLLKLIGEQNICIEVLIMDPRSEIIKLMDKNDPLRPTEKTHSTNIINNLKKLKTLAPKIKNIPLANKSTLSVRLSKEPLNTTLFYTEGGNNEEEEPEKKKEYDGILLMGMLYSHKEGNESQQFRVPPGSNENTVLLFEDCKANFKTIFDHNRHKTIMLLHNDENEKVWFNDDLFNEIVASAKAD